MKRLFMYIVALISVSAMLTTLTTLWALPFVVAGVCYLRTGDQNYEGPEDGSVTMPVAPLEKGNSRQVVYYKILEK